MHTPPAMQVNFKLMFLCLWLEHLTGVGKVMDFDTVSNFISHTQLVAMSS